MEILLYRAAVVEESARRDRVAVAEMRAQPKAVDILTRKLPVAVEGIDNPYISAD